MTIKVGINGFGRIGRMVFRAVANDFNDIEIFEDGKFLNRLIVDFWLGHSTEIFQIESIGLFADHNRRWIHQQAFDDDIGCGVFSDGCNFPGEFKSTGSAG